METTVLAGKLAGLLSLAAFIPYIVSTIKGKTKPNRATWWIWSGVGMMLGASYYASGAVNTIWVPISYVIGPLTTAIISIKYGEGGWAKFDRICVIGAAISAVLWWVFNSPLIALIINLIIDFLGALPTVKKAYLTPNSESKSAWVLFLAGNVVNLFAIERWVFAIASYPIYMFLGSGTIALLILIPRNKK